MASAEKTVKELYLSLGVVSLLLLAGGLFSRSFPFFISLLSGVVVGGANFVLLVWIVENIFAGHGVKKRKMASGRLLFSVAAKGLLLFLIIGLILKKGHVTPLPFLLGLSNVILGVLAYGLTRWLREEDQNDA